MFDKQFKEYYTQAKLFETEHIKRANFRMLLRMDEQERAIISQKLRDEEIRLDDAYDELVKIRNRKVS